MVPFRSENAVLVPLGLFILKRFTAGAFVVAKKALSKKTLTGDI